MRPIRTTESNFTYLGFKPEVADLPGQREEGRFYAVFRPSDEERERLAAGGNIELGIYCEPIPPVSLNVVHVHEATSSEHGADFRCGDCAALYVQKRAAELEEKCGQCGGVLVAVEAG